MTTEGSVRSNQAHVRIQSSPAGLDITRTQRRSSPRFNGVKVFSATMFAQRDRLGETVGEWLAQHPDFEIAEMRVTQSSDAAFHCVVITVFYWENR
jgi:hypothetical protein